MPKRGSRRILASGERVRGRHVSAPSLQLFFLFDVSGCSTKADTSFGYNVCYAVRKVRATDACKFVMMVRIDCFLVQVGGMTTGRVCLKRHVVY